MTQLDTRIVLGALVLGIILGGVAVSMNMLYPGGWEIGTQFKNLRLDGEQALISDSLSDPWIGNSYLNARGGYVKLDDGDPANLAITGTVQAGLENVYDTHPEWFGSTAVFVDVDSPYPVTRDAYGDQWYKSSDGVPYRVYEEWDSGTETYTFFAHYVYLYTVDVKTDGIAERSSYGWVAGTCEGLPSHYALDHEAQVRVFSRIGLHPWTISDGQIYTYNETEAEVDNVFYGIMSASVAKVEVGNMVESTEIGENSDLSSYDYDAYWKGLVQPHKDHSGAALSMWYADTAADYDGYLDVAANRDVEEDVRGIVERRSTIPREVIIETGTDIEPGLIVSYGWPGTWDSWTPVNKYCRYVVRVDAVYSADLIIRSGDQDPAGQKEEDQEIDDVQDLGDLVRKEINRAFDKLDELGEGTLNWLDQLVWTIVVPAVVIIGLVVIVILFLFRRG